MLYKKKKNVKNLSESIEGIVDHIVIITKRNHPILHKLLFKCDKEELVMLRFVLSLLLGVVMGNLLFWLLFSSMSNTDDIALPFISTIALGFTISVQCRCVLLLIWPTLMSDVGRWFFYIFFIKLIFNNDLFIKFTKNVERFFSIISCLISFRIELITWKFSVRSRFILNYLAGTNDLSYMENELMYSEKRAKESLMKMASSSIVGGKGSCEENLLKEAEDRCLNYFWNMDVFFVVRWAIYGLIAKSKCRGQLKDVTRQICQSVLDDIVNTNRNLNNISNNFVVTDQQSNTTSFTKPVEIIDSLKQTSKWNTIEEYHESIVNEATIGRDLFHLISSWFHTLYIICFFIAFFKANRYHQKYLNSIQFDNFYIDRYFRHIDNRRKIANKTTLLPLRGPDQLELVPIFSPEKKQSESNFSLVEKMLKYILIFKFLFVLYFNYMLSDFLDTISENLNFVYNATINHSFKPSFTSAMNTSNVFTRSANKFFEKLKYDKQTDHFEFNLNSCARYAVYETWMEYVPVFLNFMMLIICSKLSIYIARTRKLICDYFYYRYGKERTLELYNTRLSRRKQYMGERKTQIENFIKECKLNNQPFDACYMDEIRIRSNMLTKWMKYIVNFYGERNSKECFICCNKLSFPYILCDNEKCRLLFHEVCFHDFGNRCINCGQSNRNVSYV